MNARGPRIGTRYIHGSHSHRDSAVQVLVEMYGGCVGAFARVRARAHERNTDGHAPLPVCTEPGTEAPAAPSQSRTQLRPPWPIRQRNL